MARPTKVPLNATFMFSVLAQEKRLTRLFSQLPSGARRCKQKPNYLDTHTGTATGRKLLTVRAWDTDVNPEDSPASFAAFRGLNSAMSPFH